MLRTTVVHVLCLSALSLPIFLHLLLLLAGHGGIFGFPRASQTGAAGKVLMYARLRVFIPGALISRVCIPGVCQWCRLILDNEQRCTTGRRRGRTVQEGLTALR